MEKYDVAVIGAGPGGAAAAKRASQLGAKTILIEKENAGGVCLNWGCIPTKALVASASLLNKVNRSSEYGFDAWVKGLSLNHIIERKNAIVSTLRSGSEAGYKRNKINYVKGTAQLLSPNSLQVKTNDTTTDVEADKIILATGSDSRGLRMLPFDGAKVHDARTILDLKELPRSLVIIGGGAIGCEFAYIFNQFGVSVTLIELQDRLLPLEDPELGKRLGMSFQKNGIELVLNDPVSAADHSKEGIRIITESKKEIEADITLIAIGRIRNTQGIGLEKTAVTCDNDCVVVDKYCETAQKGIYAIGDLLDSPLLAHVAMYEGRVAAENAVQGNSIERNYAVVPNCVFTVPEIAHVGLTKDAALSAGYEVESSKELYSANGKAYCIGQTEGFVKLIYEKNTQKLLGAQIMGEAASDMIAEIALALKYDLTLNDIANTIHEHPTLCEAIQDAAFTGIHKSMRLQ